jgi:hypothetical protein
LKYGGGGDLMGKWLAERVTAECAEALRGFFALSLRRLRHEGYQGQSAVAEATDQTSGTSPEDGNGFMAFGLRVPRLAVASRPMLTCGRPRLHFHSVTCGRRPLLREHSLRSVVPRIPES